MTLEAISVACLAMLTLRKALQFYVLVHKL